MSNRVLMYAAVLLVGGCSNNEAGVGEERGPCYPNSTCNAGLVCASSLCVRLTGDGSAGDRAKPGDGSGKDAATDLPRKSDGPRVWSGVSTLAGAAGPGFADGPVASAKFLNPAALAIAGSKLYVADRDNHRVRVIDLQSGTVTTLAGSGTLGFLDGAGASAQFNAPSGLTIGQKGEVLVADTANHRIRAIAADGQVTTVAGTGTPGCSVGSIVSAPLFSPRGLAVDPFGTIGMASFGCNSVVTIANGSTNGLSGGNSLRGVTGLAVDSTGGWLVSEQTGHQITHLVGGQALVYAGSVSGNDDGDAAWAKFNGPSGLFLQHNTLYVADTYNHRIRLVEKAKVSTVAGTKSGYLDGPPKSAAFNLPYAVVVDAVGKIYVADMGNSMIRVIAP